MKSIILGIVIGFLTTLLGADTEGFRDLKWGDAPSKNMKFMQKEATTNSKIYYKNKDNLNIGSAKLDTILYYFFDGKFNTVFVTFKGLINFNAIKATLESKHGSASQPNQFMDDFYWFGGNSTISLSYNEIGDEGSILISNTELKDKQEEYKNNLSAQGVKDL